MRQVEFKKELFPGVEPKLKELDDELRSGGKC
jgi:hypothetical protein